MSVFVLSPLRPPPLSTKYRRRRRPPASHAINIVFHVKHTRRTRHTHTPRSRRPLCCRTSCSCTWRCTPAPNRHVSQQTLPAHVATVGPARWLSTQRCQPPTPSTPALPACRPSHLSTQPQRRRRPHAQTPTSQPRPHNPKHLSTYALSSFPALDATNVAELELRAPGHNQPTSAYERNHRD